MELRRSEDWVLRTVAGGTAVIFHPFTGDLHALPESLTDVLMDVDDRVTHVDALVDLVTRSSLDTDRPEVEHQARALVSMLLEIGVLCASRLDEHSKKLPT